MDDSSAGQIRIRLAQENNLKDISLDLPHQQLIAITGVSGSGKSSLAFEVLAKEGQRRFFQTLSTFSRQFLGKLPRPQVETITGLSPVILLGQKTLAANPRSTVGTLSDIHAHLRLLFARLGHADSPLSRSTFSFNSKQGACPTCKGLGLEEKISLKKLVAHPQKSLREAALAPTLPNGYIMYSQVTIDVLEQVCQAHGFSVDIPWDELSPEQQHVILRGSDKIKVPFGKHSLESRLKWTGITAKPREKGHYKGILNIMEDILRRDRNKNILRYAESLPCSACGGSRLNPLARSVRLHGKGIVDLADMEVNDLQHWLESVEWTAEEAPKAKPITEQLLRQIEVLQNLGLGYLQSSRASASLSAGEAQRIRLANQVTSDLSHVLYIFDEPGIGMHPHTAIEMLRILRGLVRKGNTVIMVEHDMDLVREADWIVDIGPGAGEAGGQLLFNGPLQRFVQDTALANKSATYKHLVTHQPNTATKPAPPASTSWATFSDCSHNNLKHISARIQKAGFNAVSGVAGAGKSSLVHGVIQTRIETALDSLNQTGDAEFDKIIRIDQKPIGRTPRSNPATYTGLADRIRDLFAKLPEAKERGFKKGRFSFNNKGGRCEECQGAGRIQIGMHLMGNVDVVCGSCDGQRFNPPTLEIRYKGKSIFEVLEMRVSEAIPFFEGQLAIQKQLRTLESVGLGYLSLGQPSTTLSGGEAQRVKLATQLQKTDTGATLYLLDHPSTGLHPADVSTLLSALDKLCAAGNTILCIENNRQILQHADWVVELGPGSGKAGGELVFEGPPQEMAESKTSLMGRYLRKKEPGGTKPLPGLHVPQAISLEGVSTHLLKEVDATFPRKKLTVVTGVSGSGKSSLAFDSLFAEAQSRFAENLSTYLRGLLQQSNPAKIAQAHGLGPVVAVGRSTDTRSTRSTVGTLTGLHDIFRLLYSRTAQLSGHTLSARHFSFNHENGACPACKGLGFQLACAPSILIAYPERSILEGAIIANKTGKYYGDPYGQHIAILQTVAAEKGIDLTVPWRELSEAAQNLVLYGAGEREWEVVWHFKNKTRAGTQRLTAPWLGFCNYVNDEYQRKAHNKNIESLKDLLEEVTCGTCHGKRLNSETLSIKWRKRDIADLAALSVEDLIEEFEQERSSDPKQLAIEEELKPRILDLLRTMKSLGLGYLAPNRHSRTLSGGESQRIRLTRALSAQLFGVTYVLDEPTSGLHEKDTQALIQVMQRLVAMGNTLVVVEHDENVIRAADHIIEMGPGAGKAGGEIIFQGPLEQLFQQNQSPTARYLKHPIEFKALPSPESPATFGLKNCRKHNLKGFDIHFQTQSLIALTGVSGSGKSTLLREVLLPSLISNSPVNCTEVHGRAHFHAIHHVDQAPMAQHAQSSVATYSGLMDHLRKWYAGSAEAKAAGLKRSAFSYHHKDGMCPECKGKGQIKTALDFLGDVWTKCEVCEGKRFKPETLECRVEGRNIAESLEMQVSEAVGKWPVKAGGGKLLEVLEEVGLGHLQLGQSCKTLSAGEAQRLKLSLELVDGGAGSNLYLLDEPSTGLHAQDVERLLRLFGKMIAKGHTVLFIEHHPGMIAAANQVVELGPQGGESGGYLL